MLRGRKKTFFDRNYNGLYDFQGFSIMRVIQFADLIQLNHKKKKKKRS